MVVLAILTAWAGTAADLDFAHRLYGEGQFQAAAKEYRAFLSERPDGARADEARFYLAESLVQTGARGDALPLYETLAAKERPADDRRATCLLRLGLLSYEAGSLPAAETALRRYVQDRPDAPERSYAWNALGECRLAAADAPGAKAAFAAAALAAPKGHALHEQVRFGVGRAAALADDAPAATAALTEVADGASAHAGEAGRALAEFLYRRKDFAGAAARFAKLADAGGTAAPSFRFNAGLASEKAGRLDDAVAHYQRASALPDADTAAGSLVRLARLERERQHSEAARTAARTLLDKFPNAPQRADAELALALLDSDAGKTKEARAALDAWLARNAEHKQAAAARERHGLVIA